MIYAWSIPVWDNGKILMLDYPYDSNTLKQVINEVLARKDYSPGLDYIKGIENPVVLDLGAYIGITALYFSSHKGTKIYAVEPHPESFNSLVINMKNYPNVVPINYAVGMTEETRFIAQAKDTIGMTLFGKPEDTRFAVKAVSIKTLFDEYKIDHVDMMKIDVENAEFEIFLSEGFDAVKDKIDYIIGEAHNDIMPYQAVKAILEEKGFKVKFLPMENVISSYNFKVNGKMKSLDIQLQTMFIARRV